ncbi:hypothetical protein BO71DRAFT_162427 [Aspergillus ellipticus CBS 707.79]|uniref:Secreted protein n=1 Tax=Aspergillus ellipticus CBS 707.79 TaxID=1448320 RepID=A0A319CR85_9EURO|nr:hypothetical protein BO71DRAFT_162427 [Aspergillus ellipticus CBS 707.79]
MCFCLLLDTWSIFVFFILSIRVDTVNETLSSVHAYVYWLRYGLNSLTNVSRGLPSELDPRFKNFPSPLLSTIPPASRFHTTWPRRMWCTAANWRTPCPRTACSQCRGAAWRSTDGMGRCSMCRLAQVSDTRW